MEEIEKFIQPIEEILNRGLDNIYINTSIKVFLGLYAAFAAPKLPASIVNIMDNTLIRILIAFVIVLIATKDPSIALIVSVAFVITLQTANKHRLINTSLSMSQPGETSWLPSVNTLEDSTKTPLELENETNDMLNQEDTLPNELQQKINVDDHTNLVENNDLNQNEIDTMNMSIPSENLKKPVVELLEVDTNKNDTDPFTSQYQFLDAQSNLVPEANQDSSNNTFDNQHSIQGLQDTSPDGM